MTKTIKKSTSVLIHFLVWFLLFVVVAIPFYLKLNTIPASFYYRSLVYVVVFYLNYCILIPYILLKRKFLLYTVVSVCFFLLIVLIVEPILTSTSFQNFIYNPTQTIDFDNIIPNLTTVVKQLNIFLLVLLFFALSTSIRLILEWSKKEKERVLITSQKVNSELSFLRSQLNPHFLFNTLNSIYSLANKKSDDTTTAIVTLSELMRYMIYEVNENLVLLKNEVDHIQNYIDLQLLRLKDSSGVRVNIIGDLNYKIEPMLLISFIENAFKYGTDFKGKTDITIKLSVNNNILHLDVQNKVSLQNTQNPNSGIGLENIKNRLNLLYPKTHKLIITQTKDFYKVDLSIQLKKQ